MTSAAHLSFDSTQVLVLGAGLAGLRAAMAAREADSSCPVLVATMRSRPSGSSFANRNNALGMQAPATDAQREALAARAVELARPGTVSPDLARILAQESAARLDDLMQWGLAFDTEPGGGLKRVAGCFLRDQASAVVLRDLAKVFAALASRFKGLGGEFAPGLQALGLVQESEGRVRGALLRHQDGSLLAIQAQAVILALGGTAALFARHSCGPGTPGHSLALLERAGAHTANLRCLQFMWYEADSGQAVPVHLLDRPGAGLACDDGSVRPLPPDLAACCAERSLHWPVANSSAVQDAALDHALLAAARKDLDRGGPGQVVLALPDGPDVRLARAELQAHASNGGALIDECGATTVPGLYACGECATGMHGADRVGGAMVAATQVFGYRAGRAAALEAASNQRLDTAVFKDLARQEAEDVDGPTLDLKKRRKVQRALDDLLPWPGAGSSPSIAEETWEISAGLRREDRLFLESCRALAGA